MKPTLVLGAFAVAVAVLGCGDQGGGDGSTQLLALRDPNPGVCVHLAAPWSTYECPEVITLRDSAALTNKVESVTVTLWDRNGKQRQIRLNDSTDAVFFGGRVLDSVMIPYYYGKKTKADSAKADTLKEKSKNFPRKPWWQ